MTGKTFCLLCDILTCS